MGWGAGSGLVSRFKDRFSGVLVSCSSTFRSASGLVGGSGDEQESIAWEELVAGVSVGKERGCVHFESSGSESDSSMLIFARFDAEA